MGMPGWYQAARNTATPSTPPKSTRTHCDLPATTDGWTDGRTKGSRCIAAKMECGNIYGFKSGKWQWLWR